ncbi:hypothetical protein GQ53DRAFT_743583 [Thozetella sp. PMI_491]|nr:hypothetical protein GQ53DRAFT_743583 [Thozetella sp. PMI_491]
MTFTQNPTYFLAPNWTFLRGGKIALGSIIVDPLKPHIPLTRLDPTQPQPATTTVPEANWRLSLETATSTTLGVWATFLDNVRLSLSAQRERIKNHHFTMTSLETVYYTDDPTDEELQARCRDAKVRNFMRLDSTLCKPVYMITGLKIATGFKLEALDSTAHEGAAELGGQVAPEVSVGVKAGASGSSKGEIGFESGSDIVFAYQLIKIKPKGWGKDKKLVWDEFTNSKAFLSDGNAARPAEPEPEGELDSILEGDLKELKDTEIVEVGGAVVAFKPSKQPST